MAITRSSSGELLDALAQDRLPEPASTTLRNGAVQLVHLGEERARREIDQRFAAVLRAIHERDARIEALEREVAKIKGEG